MTPCKKGSCLKCGKEVSRQGRCCRSCAYTGKKLSEEHRRKISDFRKSYVGWKHSKETRAKMSETAYSKGEQHHNYEEDVGYDSLHSWVRRRKLKPAFCEGCGVAPPYDLANISQRYHRDVKDYWWLCRPCHKWIDGVKTEERLGLVTPIELKWGKPRNKPKEGGERNSPQLKLF